MKERHGFDAKMTATGGIVAALSFVLCLTGTAAPFTKILFPALCGLLSAVVMKYVSAPTGVMSYAVTAVLLMLFSPDKVSVLAYTCLLGYYPMAFSRLGNIQPTSVRALVKMGIFTLVGSVALVVGIKLFALGENELFRKYGWLILILVLITAVVYDRFLNAFYLNMQREWDEGLKTFFRRFR